MRIPINWDTKFVYRGVNRQNEGEMGQAQVRGYTYCTGVGGRQQSSQNTVKHGTKFVGRHRHLAYKRVKVHAGDKTLGLKIA